MGRLLKIGWRVMTEVHTICWVTVDLLGITLPPAAFVSWALQVTTLASPLIFGIGFIIFCAAATAIIALLGYRSASAMTPKDLGRLVNRARAEEGAHASYYTYETNNYHLQIETLVINQSSPVTNRALARFRPSAIDGQMALLDRENVREIIEHGPREYTVHFRRPMNASTLNSTNLHPTPPIRVITSTATEVRFALDVDCAIIAVRFDD